MIKIKIFTFNPIQVNTYLLYDETGECVIIDPGMYESDENEKIKNFISANSLLPVRLLNTHYHFDHILGNKFIAENFQVSIEAHSSLENDDKYVNPVRISEMFGINMDYPPKITRFLEDGNLTNFGKSVLKVIHVPGHTQHCLVFYCEKDKFIIAGDVLFEGSIGRTDFPGGDYEQIISNITSKLMTLPDDVKVYPGHGKPTTIGRERASNPFLVE